MADFKIENGASNNQRLGRRRVLLFSLFMVLMVSATAHVERAWAEVRNVASFDINGTPTVAVLLRDTIKEKNYVYLMDANSGDQIKRLQFFAFFNTDPYAPLFQAIVPDIDGDGVPEIAVLGVDPNNDNIRVQLKNASSGSVIVTFGFDANYSPIAIAVVDISGAPAIAMLGVGISGSSIEGNVRVLVKDALSGDWIKTIGLDINFSPVAMAVVPDMDSSGTDEVAILGVKNGEPNTGNLKVVIRDVFTKATIGEAIYFDKNYPPVALAVVPDFTGNVAPEIAVLGLASNGTVKVFIKDASTRDQVGKISFPTDFSPTTMAVVPDFDDGKGALNGASEIAVLGFGVSDGKVKVIIKDADNGNWIKTPSFGSDSSSVAITVMPDFDDGNNGGPNGISEIAVLGAFTDGSGKVAIRDASTVKLINSILVPPNCNDFVPNSPPNGAQNIVLIYTDDQRSDFWAEAMPTVKTELIDKGVEFTNAFVTNPWCCPSRASLLSGGFYSHNTGVLSVGAPNGDAPKFFDALTIATVFQQNGYKTAIMGKYMNGYPSIKDPHGDEFYYIPPGWDWFRNTEVWKSQAYGGPDWFDFRTYSGNSCGDHGHGEKATVNEPGVSYVTYYQRDKALDFLGTIAPNEPFFLMLSTHAPHEPADAPKDGRQKGAGVTNEYPYDVGPPRIEYPSFISSFCWRNHAIGSNADCDTYDDWNEDINKPWYVNNYSAKNWLVPNSNHDTPKQKKTDDMNRKMLNSLWQVDNVVKDIMAKITAMGVLDNTVFVFTSDNGYLWGEHRLTAKQKPYEESIRIPLIIKRPSDTSNALVGKMVAMDIDLPPTILELAGLNNTIGGDGSSLVPLLDNPNSAWRNELFFESFESGQRKDRFPPAWVAIRTDGTADWLPAGTDTTGWPTGWEYDEWKYVEYVTGEAELYNLNLTKDPYELDSKHLDSDHAGIMGALHSKLAPLKGLAIRTENLDLPGQNLFLPEGTENTTYPGFQFDAWGGTETGTYTWSVDMTSKKCTDADNQGDINSGVYNGLPPGMVIDQNTGFLSGTPTTPDSQTYPPYPDGTWTWEVCIKVVDKSVSPQSFDENGVGLPQSYIKRFRIKINPS